MTDKPIPTSRFVEFIMTWEPLPKDFKLENEFIENTAQTLLSGALCESLEIAGLIQPQILIGSHIGLCATINGQFLAKAPDWFYVPSVKEILAERPAYTPYLDGELPIIVIEFLSNKNGDKFSGKQTYPQGKYFFYECLLKIPIYVTFNPYKGFIEYRDLENGRYISKQPDENGRYWIPGIDLFLGVWQGLKEGRDGYWLRWWDYEGNLLLWAVEKIAQEHQEKEKLIAYLKAQGIDPDNLPNF